MSRPQTLTGLTEREAVTDAMYRVLIGIDHNDTSMFHSAFVVDGDAAVLVFRGNEIKGRDNIHAQIVEMVGHIVITHMLNNIRVDVKEEGSTKSATFNAYALVQHCPPGRGEEVDGPKYLACNEYFADLVKDEGDGLWRIQKWVVNLIWAQGDPSVIQKPS